MRDRRHRSRAISPVVGVALLVAIVLVLSALTAGYLVGLSEEPEPAPEVVLALEGADEPGEGSIVHRQGDRLDGDQVRLRGVADPQTLAGEELAAGVREDIVPTAESIEVIWLGEDDTSYRLAEFSVDPSAVVPAPDVACSWVDGETNGGTDDITIDGLVVNCEVVTDRVIELRNGGVIIGDTRSDTKLLDVDGGQILGDVVVERDANLQDGLVTGSVTAHTEGVKLDNGTVDGGVTAEKGVDIDPDSAVGGNVHSQAKGVDLQSASVDGDVSAAETVAVQDGSVGGSVDTPAQIEITAGSSVAGPVTSDGDQVKVLDSTVSGPIVTDGAVKLDGATVEGDVYVDAADFDCADSSIDGEDCGSYSPSDPDDY